MKISDETNLIFSIWRVEFDAAGQSAVLAPNLEDNGIQYIDRGLTYPSAHHFSMAVTANDLTVTMLGGATWTDSAFNGWTLTDVTGGLDFSDARILQCSGSTSLIRLTSTTNKISVSWAGDRFYANDVLVIGFGSGNVSEWILLSWHIEYFIFALHCSFIFWMHTFCNF